MTKPKFLTTMRIESRLIVAALAGFVAGTLATAVQMLLWWLSATPVLESLLRDARLTAAIAMGRAVLLLRHSFISPSPSFTRRSRCSSSDG